MTQLIPVSKSEPVGEESNTENVPKPVIEVKNDINWIEPNENELSQAAPITDDAPIDKLTTVGDKIVTEFNKFRELESTRYFYFSETTGFRQTETMEDFLQIFVTKSYWLTITVLTEREAELLLYQYGVHELTIIDIFEGKPINIY